MLHVWPSTLLLLTLCCGTGQAELKSSHNDTPLQSRQRSGTRRDPWKISKLITDLSLSETVRTDLVVKYGYTNVVSDSMVTPEMAVATPEVKAKMPVKCMAPFALVMVDADAPSPYKPTARSRLHWLVVNANSSERLHEGDEVVPYEAPNPAKGTGPHRFVFLGYCQFDKRLDSSSIMPKKRDNFNLASFAKGLGTGKPFAEVFYQKKLYFCSTNISTKYVYVKRKSRQEMTELERRSGFTIGSVTPTRLTVHDVDPTKPDKTALSSTPDASGGSRRKHPFSTVAKRVVLPDGKDADKGPKAASMEDSACAPRQDSWSMPWKSLGSSLDALLSIPVSGAVHSCSSTGTDIAPELDGELFRPVRKPYPRLGDFQGAELNAHATMANTTASTSFPLGVCNTTGQCAAIDPSMACSNHTCVCPSSEPVFDGGLCNSTAGMPFPLSLGDACSTDANCSSSALCLAGQCSCPPGFQPWDDRNCTAIYTVAPAHSWTSLLVVLSCSVLAIMMVLSICVLVHRNLDARWAKSYGNTKQPERPLFSSQASAGDDTGSTHVEQPQPSQNTDSMVAPQMDTELLGADVWQRDSLLVAGERSTELSDLRGLCSAPDESFVRPVLSGEELYQKYPHLRNMSPSSPETSSEGAPTATSGNPFRAEQLSASWITVESREMSELPSALSSSPRRRKRVPKDGAAPRHVAFPAEPATSVIPAAESESQPFVTSSSAWSSFGSSLDYMLVLPPVVASVKTSPSGTDTARRESDGRRRRHAEKTKSRDDAAKPSTSAKPSE